MRIALDQRRIGLMLASKRKGGLITPGDTREDCNRRVNEIVWPPVVFTGGGGLATDRQALPQMGHNGPVKG